MFIGVRVPIDVFFYEFVYLHYNVSVSWIENVYEY